MKNDNIINYKFYYLIAIIFATFFMSIGYAAINSTSMDIEGELSFKEFESIYIRSATIDQNSNADISNSQIGLYYETIVQSTVALDNDADSTLTMNITIKNNTQETKYFDKVVYDNNFYDNENIDFTLNGITSGYMLSPGNSVSFTITFKYSDEYIASNPNDFDNILNSYINFKFKKGYSITYSNINNTSNYPSLILDGNTLNVTFVTDIPDNIKITGTTTNTIYERNTNYTYINGVLIFNNVTENLLIEKISSGSGGEPGTEVTEGDDGSVTTVTTADDGTGNVIVTGYDIDTSDVPGGSISVPDGGIDTGILVFDGHDFDLSLTAKFNFNDVTLTGTNPVIDLSVYEDGMVNGLLIMIANNYGGTSYDENGRSFSSNSNNRYIKFRLNKYVDSVLDADNRDYYYKGGTTPFRSNRFATQSSSITVTIKVYCRDGEFTSDILYNNEVIAKPRYISANNPYIMTFDSPVEDATIKIGTWTNKEGHTYTSDFEIIDFNVTKIID